MSYLVSLARFDPTRHTKVIALTEVGFFLGLAVTLVIAGAGDEYGVLGIVGI